MSFPAQRCEACSEDMTDDVCPNYKSQCIDCCIMDGDPCGHHKCHAECPCGHRAEHGFTTQSVLAGKLMVMSHE